ncbi:response regulator [Apiospora hydei]|uniref:Response regulator n=1 Tax=Apiospora hydei TaxID=1337664 RepID=A0ABR1WYZ1_9PEZI
MPEGDMAVAQGSSNNSSDFVRKLYKMLEDPNYSEVVRWGDGGDSFVVLENEKFTKTILPKHFKHSNFASFVRQLNKYDFHKVRQSEENGQSPYGKEAWEFKHPAFRADAKNNLDNIRRKAPAPRKNQATEDQFSSNTQIAALSETLAATQQQVQALQDSYFEMAHANKVFVDEIMHLQKMIKAQNSVNNELVNHLGKIDHERRHARATSNHSNQFNGNNIMSDGTEEPPAELRRARDILNSVSGDHIPEKDLRQMSIQFQQIGASPDSASSSSMMGPPGSAGMQNNYIHDPMNDLRHMVYPVGQTIGIDPFAAEHMGNIPYNRPLSQNNMGPGQGPGAVPEPGPAAMPTASPPVGAPGAQSTSPWGQKKPRVLLVEDDKICSRIGSKFLAQYDCGVEVARDGLEAVNKINTNPSWFDLIFMDIVMPHLDGVSATAMIREVSPRVPIIAMTSNINQQDLEMYARCTGEAIHQGGYDWQTEEASSQLSSQPPQESVMDPMYSNGGTGQPPTPGPYANPNMSLPMSAASSGPIAKFETTPHFLAFSGAASACFAQHGTRSGGYLTAGSGGPMAMTPGGTQRPQQYAGGMIPAMSGQQMGHMPDDGPPEKRQRLYGPGPQGPYA